MNFSVEIEKTKQLARAQIKRVKQMTGFRLEPDLISTLATINWGGFDFFHPSLADRFESELDVGSNTGRLAVALAIAEEHFPKEAGHIRFGEVIESLTKRCVHTEWNTYLRDMVVADPVELPPDWIDRLIRSEYPHGILVIDDVHYDPRFELDDFIHHTKHPVVSVLPAWESLLAMRAIAESRMHPDNPQVQIELLRKALEVCPRMILPREECPPIFMGMKKDLANALVETEFVLRRRPTAGAIIHYEHMTQEPYDLRRTSYDDYLWDLICADPRWKGLVSREPAHV